jgi:hypothetical protein
MLGYQTFPDAPITHVPATCDSGDCTFPQFSSIGVCAKVANITDLLTIKRVDNSTSADWSQGVLWQPLFSQNYTNITAYNASLPNGISLATPMPYCLQSYPATDTIAFADDHDVNATSFAHEYLIWSSSPYAQLNNTPWTFMAAEMIYHACVITYNTSVVEGISNTTIVSTTVQPLPGAMNNTEFMRANCTVSRDGMNNIDCSEMILDKAGYLVLEDPINPTQNYSIRHLSLQVLGQGIMMRSFYYSIWDAVDGDGTITDSEATDAVAEAIYGTNIDSLITDGGEQFRRLVTRYDGIAIALNNL